MTLGLSRAVEGAFAHGATRVYFDLNPTYERNIARYNRLGFQRIEPAPHIAADWAGVGFRPIHMELTPEQ